MELTLADFVLWSIAGSCVTVLLLTLVSRTLHARSERRSLDRRIICRLCLHAFETTTTDRITSCPDCGAANEKV